MRILLTMPIIIEQCQITLMISFIQMVLVLKYLQKTLNKIIKNSYLKSHKEHATKYIWDNKNKFKIQNISVLDNANFSYLKFDLDTKKNYFGLINLYYKIKLI